MAGLGLERHSDYKVVPVIVTKYTPVIKRHKTVRLMPYGQFKSLDLTESGR